MNTFYYNQETKYFSKAKKPTGFQNVMKGAEHLGTAVNLASGGIGLYKGLRDLNDESKFTVVYNTGAGPKQVVIKADSKFQALNKFKTNKHNSNFIDSAKAFRLPDEDDDALAYSNQLKSSGKFKPMSNGTNQAQGSIQSPTPNRQSKSNIQGKL